MAEPALRRQEGSSTAALALVLVAAPPGLLSDTLMVGACPKLGASAGGHLRVQKAWSD